MMDGFNPIQAQKGAGLVEIMIAIALGLFLSAGFFQIMSSSKQTYKTQTALARLQGEARYALDTMTEHLRLAGARTSSLIDKASAFRSETITTPVTLPFGAEQVLSGIDNDNVAADVLNGTDVIAVRYQGAQKGTTRDCLGFEVDPDSNTVDVYYVSTSFELRCSNGNGDQILANGVENLQILYGMEANPDPADPQASCYLHAANIGPGSECSSLDFDQVVSVRLGLLLHTAGTDGLGLRKDNDTSSYLLGGESVAVNDTSDHRLRRAFSTTLGIRNRLK